MSEIDDELSYLGPVGRWPFRYRVQIRDVGRYDGNAEFKVSLQKYTKQFGYYKTVYRTYLYDEGRERLPDRTEKG